MQQQATVGGDGDLPAEVAALHVFDESGVETGGDGCLPSGDNVAGSQDPGGQSRG